MLNEFRALNSWHSHGGQFFYWRTESGNEVDLIWQRGPWAAGFEIKAPITWRRDYHKSLQTLLRSGEIQRMFGVYRGDRILKVGEVAVLSYGKAIEMARDGDFIGST